MNVRKLYLLLPIITIGALCSLLILENSLAESVEDKLPWFDFSLSWHQELPYPVNISRYVLDAPAGKHGALLAKGEELVFEDGTPFKLWGVGVAFSNAAKVNSLPPPKHVASALADKIASFGFNHVRLVGFDGNAPAAMLEWRKSGKVKSKMLDRLDFFVNELRRRGIYYSFSLNNNSALLFSDSAILPPNSKPYRFQAYRTTRIFDNDAREYVAAWTKAFFLHRNPYTKLTYAEDPANVYFNAVNEDTAFIAYYSRLRKYDDGWSKKINLQFTNYLNNKYSSNDKLKEQWQQSNHSGLQLTEDLQSGNVFLRPRTMFKFSEPRRFDTSDFLTSLDMDMSKRVHDAISDVGYKGLFTGNNKWYGLGSLYSDYLTGNYIDGHVYFGKSVAVPGKNKKSRGIVNESYITKLASGSASVKKLLQDTRFGFSRVIPANLIDRPYVVSEWNHAIWNDYSYEGLFLMLALGARVGIDGMDLHSLYNHPKPSFDDAIPRTAFTVMGNPLHTAVLPTLGLAFQRGYIKKATPVKIVCLGESKQKIMVEALELPRIYSELENAIDKHGIEYVRTAIGDGCNTKAVTNINNEKNVNNVPDNSVTWSKIKSDEGRLDIVTKKYEAVVGDLKNMPSGKRVLSGSLEHAGTVTAISLDDEVLVNSQCILVTIAGPIRNRDSKWRYDGNIKIIDETGKGTPQLRGNAGELMLSLNHVTPSRKLWALDADGEYSQWPLQKTGELESSIYSTSVDKLGTPWLLLGDEQCIAAQ